MYDNETKCVLFVIKTMTLGDLVAAMIVALSQFQHQFEKLKQGKFNTLPKA